ncbi:hypothetical protein Bca52824_065257 [Brassica carinata]|uniref:Uncharacterized protein n=1 Tax=Brassica carinata TaxID=52824 RepID=A0A8X7QK04_BRACI|nr:hypothetical protein Bca52824_065257 [Brassica carinata]
MREKAKDAQTYDVEDNESDPEPDKEAPDGAAKVESPMVAYLELMFSKRLNAMQSMVERLTGVRFVGLFALKANLEIWFAGGNGSGFLSRLLVDLRHLVLSSQGYLSSSSLRKQRFLYQISASLLFVLDVPLPATPVRRLWRRTCLVVAAKLACFLAVRFGDGSSGMGLGFKCFVALCTCPDLVAVARPRAVSVENGNNGGAHEDVAAEDESDDSDSTTMAGMIIVEAIAWRTAAAIL